MGVDASGGGQGRTVRRVRSGIFVSYIMVCVTTAAVHGELRERPEIVFHGGSIVDGTGAPAVRGDVGIRGDRIVAIGPDLSDTASARLVDATGCIVTPGFIDIHSHSDLTLVIDPRAESAVAQGVTTELVGNCGHGCAPIDRPRATRRQHLWLRPEGRHRLDDMAGYLDAVDAARPAVNVAALVPYGTLRLTAMADAGAPTTAADRRRDRAAARGRRSTPARSGCRPGSSTRSRAWPPPPSIEALCRLAGRRDRLYACHTRNKDVHAVEAVDEAILTAERAGVRLQVSHLVPRPGAPDGALARSIEHIDRAADRGLDVAFDVHTRLFGFTNLAVALPRWVVDGGPDGIRAVLRNRRDELAGHRSIVDSFGIRGWDGVFITDAPATPEVAGRSLAELAAEAGRPARDIVFDVLAAHADRVDEPMAIGWSYTVDQIAEAAAHPRCAPSSDATTLSPDGPLARHVFHGAYTWAAWYLETIVARAADAAARGRDPPADQPARRADRAGRPGRRPRRSAGRPGGVRAGGRPRDRHVRDAEPAGDRDAPRRRQRRVRAGGRTDHRPARRPRAASRRGMTAQGSRP